MSRLSSGTTLLFLLLAGYTHQAFAIANSKSVSAEQFATDFPWVVAIVNDKNGGVCGGVLIAPRMVLTAAHCTSKRRHVLVGNVERSEARRVAIQKAMRHPDFDAQTLQNDVGLLYLAEAVDNEFALLATDAEYTKLLRPDAPSVILGWGKTAKGQPLSDRLRQGDAVLEQLRIQGSQFIYTDPHTGPCGYDSGGPMVMKNQFDQQVVMGVASATVGNLCISGGGTAIYTQLASVREFIDTQLRRFADRK